MDITKRAKRWMATVMTTALALTSLVVAPKPASAATDVPTVEVKGATLRLAGTTDGKQSMRIGVVISKADLATACGIQIGYKDKTTTIATDNGYDKIYDYDEAKQEVVYTAVITDIPSTAFADDFTITGLVKGTDDTEYTLSSSVEKSIDGVVESLGTDYKLVDGILVKKASEMDINNVKDGQYVFEQVAVQYKCEHAVQEYNNETCLKVSKGENTVASAKFGFSDKNSDGRKFWLEVDACSDSGYKISSYSMQKSQTEATDSFVKTGCFITGDCSKYDWESFILQPITEGDDLYVKSFAVYEAVSSLGYDAMEIDRGFVTLSVANETINDGLNKISYADGKANVEKLSKMYGGLGVAYNFKPNGEKIDLSKYSKIILSITAEADYPLCVQLFDDITGDDYWGRTGSAKKGAAKYPTTGTGTNTITYNISDIKGDLTEAEAIIIKMNPPKVAEGVTEGSADDTRPDGVFTINSIQLQ